MQTANIRQRPIPRADEAFTPVVLLLGFYLATLLGGSFVAMRLGIDGIEQWIGLVAIALATVATVAIIDRGQWAIGLVVPARKAAGDFARGAAIAVVVVGSAHLLILATTSVRHVAGDGIALGEWIAVFAPAAIHEELLFRGYAFQRIAAWNRIVALTLAPVLFAILHLGNDAMNAVAFANLILAGVLLSLGYLVARTLWLPIGLHLVWNLVSGPLLGHEVSGYIPRASLSRLIDRGPEFVTGGEFGLEASVFATVAQLGAIAFLASRLRRNARETVTVVND